METAPFCILGSTVALGTRVHTTSSRMITACHHPRHEQTPVPECESRHLLWNWELEEPLHLPQDNQWVNSHTSKLPINLRQPEEDPAHV